MKTSDQTRFAIEPKAHWLFEQIASFFRVVIDLHLTILKIWGHFFLMFMGVVLSVIALTEFSQSQTMLTSLLQIAVGATLIFSNRTRESIWLFALLTVAWFISLTLFGMLILGEGFEFTDPSVLLKGILTLIYLAPPAYGTYLISLHRQRKLTHAQQSIDFAGAHLSHHTTLAKK
jgi:hypothetical protein